MRPGACRPGRADFRVAGFTLLELLVVMVLTGLLLGSVYSLLSTLSRGVAQGMDRWDRMEAERTVWISVERDLRPGLPDRDWQVTSAGVLRLRAFRGVARICGEAGSAGVFPVAWQGERLPVPGRDSLLVLGSDGGWRGAGLTDWNENDAACTSRPGERAGWMEWSGSGSRSPVLVRLFERGSYSFHAGAFRYARGGGLRQPLTPELFGSDSRFELAPGGLRIRMEAAEELVDLVGTREREIRIRVDPGPEEDGVP